MKMKDRYNTTEYTDINGNIHKKIFCRSIKLGQTSDNFNGGYKNESRSVEATKECERISKLQSIKEFRLYAHANQWDYFITLTLKNKRDNSYKQLKEYFTRFIRNIKYSSPDLKYLAVLSNSGTSGRWHVHLLCSNLNPKNLHYKRKNKIINGEKTKIYSVSKWEYGLSEATQVKEPVHYLISYLCNNIKGSNYPKGVKKFNLSKGLPKCKEVKSYNTNVKNEINNQQTVINKYAYKYGGGQKVIFIIYRKKSKHQFHRQYPNYKGIYKINTSFRDVRILLFMFLIQKFINMRICAIYS